MDAAGTRWGTFPTQDPIGLAGGTNLYAYAGNNPVAWSDPYGLCPEFLTGQPCSGAVASAIGYVPGLGDAVDVGSALAGKDLLTGEQLTAAARIATVVGTIAGSGRTARQALQITRRLPTARLRAAWERLTGKKWPKEASEGNQVAHHRQPLADGGADAPENIEPMPQADHVRHHQENGDFARWGRRGNQKEE